MINNHLLPDVSTESTTVIDETGAVSFGTGDRLSSSGITGIADSKTFTLSLWFYITPDSDGKLINLTNYFYLDFDATNARMRIYAKNTSGTAILEADYDWPSSLTCPLINTFTNVIISCDMSNTSKRHIYINDISNALWNTYTNSAIGFTTLGTANDIPSTAQPVRMSNVFFDQTYRDLSIEANRRLFITADGKPASGQASLNPILYLPMKDASTAHINLGTGGDFIQNGVLDTATRSPDLYDCVASGLDGSDDYLSSSNIGIADGYSFTLSCTFRAAGTSPIFSILKSTTDVRLGVYVENNRCYVYGETLSGTEILNGYTTDAVVVYNSIHTIEVSVSLTNTSLRYFKLDGNVVNATWTKYLYNGLDLLPTTPTYAIGKNLSSFFEGSIGEFYFDTVYTDPSSNKFWDTDNNKPKSVLQVLEDTGSTPPIAMPIRADNPTKNYGTGGDFALNGGGLGGARGASEYISRSVFKDGGSASDYFYKPSVAFANSKTFSLSFAFRFNYDSLGDLTFAIQDSTSQLFSVYLTSGASTSTVIVDLNSAGFITQLAYYSDTGYPGFADTWHTIMISLDTDNASVSKIYIDNNFVANIPILSTGSNVLYPQLDSIYPIDAYSNDVMIANTYFTTDYIDFSQESNRNLFVNQLGYPKDLSPLIAEGTIPDPLVYLPFDDAANLGKNLGTGGDFSASGAVTRGQSFTL